MDPLGVEDSEVILEARDLRKYFRLSAGLHLVDKGGILRAVDGVSLKIHKGETLGLVGESGCGKTTVARLLLRLLEPASGDVLYRGTSILKIRGRELRRIRQKLQIVFQDPYASLNPRMRVGEIIEEPLAIHGLCRHGRARRVAELLEMVGLTPGSTRRYPHEFSGGQRQRICLARALASDPELVVADEPVSSLDCSVQAQIINLMQDLQETLGLCYLFVTHDISVVRHISHRIAVMYLGKILELAPAEELVSSPLHPYTRAILAAVPSLDLKKRRSVTILRDDPPSPLLPPSGCRFHPRCPEAKKECREVEPESQEKRRGHWVSCHM